MAALRRLWVFGMLGLMVWPLMADDSPVIAVQRLKMETALAIAQASIEACRKEGVQIAVTVVDRGGHTQVVLRDVLAPDLTLEVSYKKAYTAMSFSVPSGQLIGRFPDPNSVGKARDIMISKGGLPIAVGGNFFGGVGVSGAPSGELDEKCAAAGLRAVTMDLEMI